MMHADRFCLCSRRGCDPGMRDVVRTGCVSLLQYYSGRCVGLESEEGWAGERVRQQVNCRKGTGYGDGRVDGETETKHV